MVREQIAGFWFEWDEEKSTRCERERGFNFSAAAEVFFDEYGVGASNMSWRGEERRQISGMTPLGVILLVVFEIREYDGQKSYRIISAREATKTEKRQYWRGI